MTKTKNNKTKSVKSNKTVKKTVEQNVSVESAANELKKLSILLIVIIGVICFFYILTIIFTKKNQVLKYQNNEEISQISYTDILASDILRKDGTHYVLVKNDDDPYISLYETYISSYISSEEHLPVYYVDLNDALNQGYKSEQSSISVDYLQFSGTTLLKISNHMIESYYEDSASIHNHLKSLVAE